MKDFVFISDFDGTLTKKDFYKIIMEKYMGEQGEQEYKAWKAGKYDDKDFLNMVYGSINRNEEEILEDILAIEWDDNADKLIKSIESNNGEFIILSAGSSYYIEKLLQHKGINNIKIYSNPGEYKDKGIHLKIDEASPYYSKRYGIDKEKVVQEYKQKYKSVYFAGDSGPDVPPAKVADKVFAKGKLQQLLDEEKVNYIPIKNFSDIITYLEEEGKI